jgi:P-type Ca2+ transporter type 2B
MGYDFHQIRRNTPGRSEKTRKEGKKFDYSSARKMMSWAVKNESGGYRVYSKGGGDLLLKRCTSILTKGNEVVPINEDHILEAEDAVSTIAALAMRTIAFGYKDLPQDVNFASLDENMKQPDGTPAFSCECNLTLIGILGIEDPLRDEVPPAIQKCYTAGIDVRMVTGDNLETGE